MVAHFCNPPRAGLEAEGRWVQGHLGLHTELEASLGSINVVSYFNKTRKEGRVR